MPIEIHARPYKIPVTITNPGAVTNVQLTAAAAKSLVVTEVRIEPAQAALVTDAGARLLLGRKTTTATGLTSVAASTFVNLDPVDTDASLTCGHTATGEGTDGDVVARGWRSIVGFEWFPTPDSYILVPAGGMFMVKHAVAPPAGTYTFELTVHEIA